MCWYCVGKQSCQGVYLVIGGDGEVYVGFCLVKICCQGVEYVYWCQFVGDD